VTLKPSWKPGDILQPRIVWLEPNAYGDALMIAYPDGARFTPDERARVHLPQTGPEGRERMPVPLAIARVKKVYAAARMALAQVEFGQKFDDVRVLDPVGGSALWTER